ncbi:MAG: hypothetical protein Q9198_001216 [Flavoplaca austrocitrina]
MYHTNKETLLHGAIVENDEAGDTAMEHDPSLGSFTSLPRELRNQIWESLSVQRRFAIFQTSRQIYTEATHAFYNIQTLHFHISPEYQYKSWLSLESNFDAEWPPRLRVLESLDHALQQGLHQLPFEKLKKIKINIAAPDTADPGQLICLYKKCVDLAALLEHAKHGLPDMEINLLDSAFAKWSSGNNRQPSISIDPERHFPYYEFDWKRRPWIPMTSSSWVDYRPIELMCYNLELDPYNREDPNDISDDQIVLYAFLRLRNARSARVSGPEQPENDCFFLENVATTLEQVEPFGSCPDPDDFWGDESLQEESDKLFLQMDLDLDLLHGPTANMMRLDRFSSWFPKTFGIESRYERDHERIIKTWTDYALSSRRLWSLFRRYVRMRALNPMSKKRQYSRPGLVKRVDSGQPGNMDDVDVSADESADDGWDQDAWHEAWPLGISAFDTAECSRAYREGHDESRSTHRDTFDKRIRGWLEGDDGGPAKRYSEVPQLWGTMNHNPMVFYQFEDLPYDLNHPPMDARETYGFRVPPEIRTCYLAPWKRKAFNRRLFQLRLKGLQLK